MQEINWLDMLLYKEELHSISRLLLSQSNQISLKNSELENLSLVYLYPDDCTPLMLSHKSGMKKEAISRTIRVLHELKYIEKLKDPNDERSYKIHLTALGNQKLDENYAIILKPFYELSRLMGDDFKKMFELIQDANKKIKNN